MTYVGAELRRLVIERAGRCCEYCLVSQDDIFFPFEIDHIISEKHGGETTAANLCLSCPDCNAYKGSDIGSIDHESGQISFLFNPRQQIWQDHFRLNGAEIEPLTPEGRVTVFLLRLNDPDRVSEREQMIKLRSYPRHLKNTNH